MCSCCVYMYQEHDSQVLEQLKMSISRYTYFYIMYLCHSPIYFTLPRGYSSPLLVQLEAMTLLPILYQNVALFKLFKKNLGVWSLSCHERTAKEILLCLERSLEADILRKRRVSSAGRKEKNQLEVK